LVLKRKKVCEIEKLGEEDESEWKWMIERGKSLGVKRKSRV